MSSCKQPSILLVEDDEVDIMNVRRAFKKANFTNPLYVAQDGIAALQLLRGANGESERLHPQIVLLDLNLPRMNGIELLRELRADPKLRNLVVIVLTTSDDERDIVSAYQLNVAGYLVKPPTFAKFVEAISAVGLYWSLNLLP